MSIKYTTMLLVSALVVVIEYLIVGIIADSIISKKIASRNQVKAAVQQASIHNLEDEEVLPSEESLEELEIISQIPEDDSISQENLDIKLPEIIENPEDISPVPEAYNADLNYGDLHSEVIDIPESPVEITLEEEEEDI
jgi:hypothetical protein